MRVVLVAGARPNFVKIAPLHAALSLRDGVEPIVLHTGQHYDEEMSQLFFDQLGIPRPKYNLGVGSASHAEQTARIMMEFEKVILNEPPDIVVVVGDVNSTAACSLVAAKLGIPSAHVEAGLRSRDRRMPEEINRIVTDALCDLLFTTSRDADENLVQEGISRERIFFVGNVMIDTLLRFREAASRTGILERLSLRPGDFALLTLHRPSNVDDPAVLARLFEAVVAVSRRLPVVVPLHPRTRSRMEEFGLGSVLEAAEGVRVLPPLGYLEFLALEAQARLVLTDSGGIQEETTVLGVPCLTLRPNTERPVTCTQGTNRLVGNDPARIIAAVEAVLSEPPPSGRVPELWDGKAAERIADILVDRERWLPLTYVVQAQEARDLAGY